MNLTKSIKHFIQALLILPFLIACDENAFITEVDIDTAGHEPKLTISARLIKNDPVDQKQYVFVTESKSINDPKEIQTVKGAKVTLWEGDKKLDTGLYVDSIVRKNYNYRKKVSGYLLSYKDFKANTEYTLKASAPGFDPVQSTVRMPEKSVISNAEYIKDGFNIPDDPGNTADVIKLSIPNLDEGKFYLIKVEHVQVFQQGNLKDSTIRKLHLIPVNPLYFEYSFANGSDILFRGEDLIHFKDKIKVAFDPISSNTKDSYYTVRVYDITQDQYSFLVSYQQYRGLRDNPFVEPVVVYSNIENGLGIFSLEQHQAIKVTP